ncbi:MAG TPA: alpha/beta fold hydrolase [Solirubrobacteraceae bacterium]|nr:alpha/beta fold hydrolase [Solirubrobacteraceae bacterium]
MIEDVVLLHGFGGTRGAWAGVEKLLPAERYRPLALDLPGHGEQTDVRPPITFEKCVASVLERSPKRFVLGGYSMGGRVALHVALQAPQRVKRLVLVSSTAGIEDEKERAARRKRDRRFAKEIEQGSIEDFIERWRSKPMFAQDPPEVDALARADQACNRPSGVAAALRGIGTGEMQSLWEKLVELEMPVTVVAGHRDRKFVRTGERMVKLLPDSLLHVTGGGHCLLFENPKNVAMALS